MLFDLVIALLLSTGPVTNGTPVTPLMIWATIGATAGLLLRRRFPEVAIVAGLAALLVTASPLPALVALYTLARRRGPGLVLWCAGGLTVVCLVVAEIVVQEVWFGFPVLLGVAVKAALYSVPLMLGLWLHQRAASLTATRERIDRAEREQALLAERAVTEERRRIAREMHDVVAHRASVMTLQAGALSVRAPDERTAETAEIIRQNSAKALTELREMLQVLRDTGNDEDDGGAGARSGPSVGGVASLVRETADAGTEVSLRMPDVPPETSPAVGRAAYRVVQEALTNAAKHAAGAPVRVDVEVADEQLVLTVDNDRGTESGAAATGSGYGLLGMRERAAFVGGALETGPTGSGGYRVRAVLPL
nr:sensor histidine kinase [Saccharopolyspora sp. HNM0983]